MITDKYNIFAGEVINTFGHKGEVKVYPHTDFPDRFSARKHICVKLGENEPEILKITRSRIHKNIIIVKFAGIDDMTAAENLRGAKLYVKDSDKNILGEGEYLIRDIIGMAVTTTTGEDLGIITEVLRSPANDVYVTERAMIPAVKEFVASIDVLEKKMTVNPVEGLIQDKS